MIAIAITQYTSIQEWTIKATDRIEVTDFKLNEANCMPFLSQNLHLLKTRLSASQS